MTTDHETAAALQALLARPDTLGPSGRLPPERQLAATLGVSRARLRKALDRLEAEGRIFRRHGQGTFAAPPPAGDAARLKTLARKVSPGGVMEVRLAIEPALAALAADRGTAEDIARLQQLEQDTRAAAAMAAYDAADDLFHYKIAEMAQNPLFLTVYEAIRSVRRQAGWTRQRQETYSAATLPRLGQQHAAITAAIARRDAPAAAQAMETHLRDVARTLLGPDGPAGGV